MKKNDIPPLIFAFPHKINLHIFIVYLLSIKPDPSKIHVLKLYLEIGPRRRQLMLNEVCFNKEIEII